MKFMNLSARSESIRTLISAFHMYENDLLEGSSRGKNQNDLVMLPVTINIFSRLVFVI